MRKGISKEEAALLEESGSGEEQHEDVKLFETKTAPKAAAKPLQSAALKTAFVKGKNQTHEAEQNGKRTELLEKREAPSKTQALIKKPAVVAPAKMQTRKDSASKHAESAAESKQPSRKNSEAKKPAKKEAVKTAPAKHLEPESLSHSSQDEAEVPPAKTVAAKPTAAKSAPAQHAKAAPAKPAPAQPVKAAPAQPAKAVLAQPAKPAPAKTAIAHPAKAAKKESLDIDSEDEAAPAEKRVKQATLSKPAHAPAKPALTKKEQQPIKSESEMELEEEEPELLEEEEEAQEEEEEVEEPEPPKPAPKAAPAKSALAAKAAPQTKPAPLAKPAQAAEKPFAKGGDGARQGQGQFRGESFEVFVEGIDFNATEQDVTEHFASLPDFLSIKLLTRDDGAHTGKCFIKFGSAEGQSAALELSQSTIGSRKIFVNLPRPRGDKSPNPAALRNNFGSAPGEESSSVIVRNMPFDIDEDKLHDHFSGCGTIRSVRIIRKEDGTSKGFGFVDFNELDSAKKALLKNGNKLGARSIDVQYSIPRTGFGAKRGDSNGDGPRGGYDRGGFGGRGRGRGAGGFNDAKKGMIADVKMNAVELDDD